MILVSPKGSSKVRKFNSWNKRTEKYDKSLIKFTYPGDIKGTSLLSHIERKSDNEKQWIYLPAFKKLRRIGGGDRGDRFVNTEFYYQDLRPLSVDDYSYKLLKEEKCGKVQCYVIESKAKSEKLKKDWPYSKVVTWLRKDNYFQVKANFYNKKGKIIKELVLEKAHKVKDKCWRADKMTMTNLKTKRKTILKLTKISVKKSIPDEIFSSHSLEK